VVDPTKLFVEETTPVTPVDPSPHVTEPTSDAVPESQLDEATTKFPFVSATTEGIPTLSDAVDPTRLLDEETTPPGDPVTLFPQVTAPTAVSEPEFQLVELTT
jgi:hypothetical protein